MAEDTPITIAKDYIESLTKGLTNINESFDRMTDKLSEVMGGFNGIVNTAGTVVERTKEASQNISFFANEAKKAFYDSVSGQDTPLMRALVGVAGAAFKPTESMKVLGQEAAKSTGSLEASRQAIEDYTKYIPGFGSTIARLGENFIEQWEAISNAEDGFRRMLGTSGDLFQVFSKGVPIAANLSKELMAYQTHLYNVAQTTDETMSQVATYYGQLGQISGAYKTMIGEGVQKISLMEAAIKTAKGTGQDFGEIFKVMNNQFRRFGDVGEKPLGLFAQMNQTAQHLGIRLEFLTQNVDAISQSFRVYGDSTEGALKITKGFFEAFRGEEGVGPEIIQSITKGVTESIAQMDIAQKGFLSGQTGGAGGLRGAYEVELKLREGNIDEVYQMMETALRKQFGGRIRTLEEGSQSDTAAAELTRQVAFLRQGPFGQVAKTDADAYRLLEAFRKGTRPSETLATNREAYQQALTESVNIQKLHTNIFRDIQNKVGIMKDRAARVAVEGGRYLVGAGGGKTLKPEGLYSGIRGETMKNAAAEEAIRIGALETRKKTPGGSDIKTAYNQASEIISRSVNEYKQGFAGITDKFLPNMAEIFNIHIDDMRKRFEQFASREDMAKKDLSEVQTLFFTKFPQMLKPSKESREIRGQETLPMAPRTLPQREMTEEISVPGVGTITAQPIENNNHFKINIVIDPNKQSQNFEFTIPDTGTPSDVNKVQATPPTDIDIGY